MATLYAYSPNGTQATLSYSVIGFTQSLAQNGWCKLPNGLILQWPTAKKNNVSFEYVSYPVKLTSVFSVLTTIIHNSDPELANSCHSISTSGCYVGSSFTSSHDPARYMLVTGV
ncbi:MAG: hypothetical protein SPF22_07745 [Candidatus Onthovivens sp.]|nr:hypothetical protein [Candidatus Onthovivens sp.]